MDPETGEMRVVSRDGEGFRDVTSQDMEIDLGLGLATSDATRERAMDIPIGQGKGGQDELDAADDEITDFIRRYERSYL